jgi:hypothetical protein
VHLVGSKCNFFIVRTQQNNTVIKNYRNLSYNAAFVLDVVLYYWQNTLLIDYTEEITQTTEGVFQKGQPYFDERMSSI